MSKEITEIVIPILRTLQSDFADLKTDVAEIKTDLGVLKENTGKIDLRLKIVESHMSGFMSSAKYLEGEIDQLRGRVEALEENQNPEKPQ